MASSSMSSSTSSSSAKVNPFIVRPWAVPVAYVQYLDLQSTIDPASLGGSGSGYKPSSAGVVNRAALSGGGGKNLNASVASIASSDSNGYHNLYHQQQHQQQKQHLPYHRFQGYTAPLLQKHQLVLMQQQEQAARLARDFARLSVDPPRAKAKPNVGGGGVKLSVFAPVFQPMSASRIHSGSGVGSISRIGDKEAANASSHISSAPEIESFPNDRGCAAGAANVVEVPSSVMASFELERRDHRGTQTEAEGVDSDGDEYDNSDSFSDQSDESVEIIIDQSSAKSLPLFLTESIVTPPSFPSSSKLSTFASSRTAAKLTGMDTRCHSYNSSRNGSSSVSNTGNRSGGYVGNRCGISGINGRARSTSPPSSSRLSRTAVTNQSSSEVGITGGFGDGSREGRNSELGSSTASCLTSRKSSSYLLGNAGASSRYPQPNIVSASSVSTRPPAPSTPITSSTCTSRTQTQHAPWSDPTPNYFSRWMMATIGGTSSSPVTGTGSCSLTCSSISGGLSSSRRRSDASTSTASRFRRRKETTSASSCSPSGIGSANLPLTPLGRRGQRPTSLSLSAYSPVFVVPGSLSSTSVNNGLSAPTSPCENSGEDCNGGCDGDDDGGLFGNAPFHFRVRGTSVSPSPSPSWLIDVPSNSSASSGIMGEDVRKGYSAGRFNSLASTEHQRGRKQSLLFISSDSGIDASVRPTADIANHVAAVAAEESSYGPSGKLSTSLSALNLANVGAPPLPLCYCPPCSTICDNGNHHHHRCLHYQPAIHNQLVKPRKIASVRRRKPGSDLMLSTTSGDAKETGAAAAAAATADVATADVATTVIDSDCASKEVLTIVTVSSLTLLPSLSLSSSPSLSSLPSSLASPSSSNISDCKAVEEVLLPASSPPPPVFVNLGKQFDGVDLSAL